MALSAEDDRLVSYARELAVRLEEGMRWMQADYSSYWEFVSEMDSGKMSARATAAQEFLRLYAGEDSQWFKKAEHELTSNRKSYATACRAVADILRGWSDQVSAGLIIIERQQQSTALQIVNNDLMSQVRSLNEDRAVSPVAPIVLAGASLEIALRGAATARGLELVGRPSISAWGKLLRQNSVISAQEMKDIEQVGGLRNSAAHGQLEELSAERAGIMEQQVNLLLARLEPRVSPESLGADPNSSP